MILLALLGCMLTKAPEDLRAEYCRATWAWYPYYVQVKEVKWCESWEYECSLRTPGGGGYDYNNATIEIDREFPWPVRDGLFLTLAHEYGHALGLGHNQLQSSIMRSGWDGVIATGVSDGDKETLKKLLDKSDGLK